MGKEFTTPNKKLNKKSYADICKISSQKNYIASIADDITKQLGVPKDKTIINLFEPNNTKKVNIEYDYALQSIVIGLDNKGNIERHSLGIHNKAIFSKKAVHVATCDSAQYKMPPTLPQEVLSNLSEANDTNEIEAYITFMDGFKLEPTTPFIHLNTLICGYNQCDQCSKKDMLPVVEKNIHNTNDGYKNLIKNIFTGDFSFESNTNSTTAHIN